MDERPHDPNGVMRYAGKHKGQTGLIVLGGNSGAEWEKLKNEIHPDVLIIVNGVNAKIKNADYWLLAENMTRARNLSLKGDEENKQYFAILNRLGPRVRFVSHRSWHMLTNRFRAVMIRRKSYDLDQIPPDFSIRKYVEGFWGGWLMKDKKAGALVMVGTVGLHALHLAGILGLSKVHTIGYDLCFKDETEHHWYPYPPVRVDRFRNPSMFVEHEGLKTQVFWVETAQYLKAVEHRFTDEGMIWKDHSNGLLQRMGLEAGT